MNKGAGSNRKGVLCRRVKGRRYFDLADPAGKDGVIWLRYMVGGKLFEKSLGTRDIKEARKKQTVIMRPIEMASEEEVLELTQAKLEGIRKKSIQLSEQENPPLRIADAWEAFCRSLERDDVSEGTQQRNFSYWNRFSIWIQQKHPSVEFMRDVTAKMGQEYAAALHARNISSGTFNKQVCFLRRFFRLLAAEGNVEENPFARISTKRLRTNARRELTIAELTMILGEAEGDLRTLLHVGTFTGLRLGDCCTLKWGEVDMDRGVIRRVQNKTASRHQKPVLIGIPAALHAELSRTPPQKRRGFVLKKYAELYTYRNSRGVATKQARITRQIQAHFEKCGIQTLKEGTGVVVDPETGKKVSTGKRAVVEVGFHSLRHTFVSLHAERGTPQAVVQAVVGHGSPAMTAHYTHIGEETARQVAGVLTLGDSKAEEAIDDIQQKLGKIRELASRITGKRNEAVKAELLEMLNDGEG